MTGFVLGLVLRLVLAQAAMAGAQWVAGVSALRPRLQAVTLDKNQLTSRTSVLDKDVDPVTLYPAHNFSVPIDHFQDNDAYIPHSNGTFSLRYWFDATYYRPGGPVFVLAGGETSGVDRLPFLQKGIIYEMAQATGGLGVILEHRYYGTSFPVPDLSIENLRFLTTEQALADTKYFAENIVFPGLEGHDLTSKDTAWIAYGGSYAGAFVAFLRTLYPDVFWGAISSSGVTEAIIDYWEYFEAIRIHGPENCITFTQDFIEFVDTILLDPAKSQLAKTLKNTLGLPGVPHNDDFAAVLTEYGIGAWQSRNWDPAVSSPTFDLYCSNVSETNVLYPETERLRAAITNLTEEVQVKVGSKEFVNQVLNFAGWLNTTALQSCASSGQTQDQCFGSYNASQYLGTGFEQQVWRSWQWQVCTQWGYFQTSDVPDDIRPIQSRLINLPYTSKICQYAFNITSQPDIDAINKYGGYGIEYDRLAIVDGQADPWEYATPHRPGLKKRKDTIERPFIEIEGAVHHWDENGLFPNQTTASLPPAPVKNAQDEIVRAVQQWVLEYDDE